MEEDYVTRVALLGLGIVGSAVARRLLSSDLVVSPVSTVSPVNPVRIALTHIFDRRADEKCSTFGASAGSAGVTWTTRIDDVLRSDVDIVIEAVGGIEPAAAWARQSLTAGKSVVTVNKQLVARHGAALWRLAARQGRQFRFEGAVGGAMPIVRAVADGLAGDRLTRIVAILNGTTNAVLSEMEATGGTMSAALADARGRGFAEADPSADLDGEDARAKLAILCALAFGVDLDPRAIPVRSASSIAPGDFARARRRNGTVRQIAHADYDWRRSTLTAWVAPVVVPTQSIFGMAVGAQNVALITGEHSGEVGIFGAGAGGAATAVAVIGDVASIARDRAAIVPPPRLNSDFTMRQAELPTLSFAEAV
jgi:homoserine dehydrogenase